MITGDGKGKTTIALGTVSRALGQSLKCSVIRFVKEKPASYGEYGIFSAIGVDRENHGRGFLWNLKNTESMKAVCAKVWESFSKASGHKTVKGLKF